VTRFLPALTKNEAGLSVRAAGVTEGRADRDPFTEQDEPVNSRRNGSTITFLLGIDYFNASTCAIVVSGVQAICDTRSFSLGLYVARPDGAPSHARTLPLRRQPAALPRAATAAAGLGISGIASLDH
jgi:hypothetical protein